MSDDLVKRLEVFANGCRGSMWQSRDKTIGLLDEAAARIRELEAELAALREARGVRVKDAWEKGFSAAASATKQMPYVMELKDMAWHASGLAALEPAPVTPQNYMVCATDITDEQAEKIAEMARGNRPMLIPATAPVTPAEEKDDLDDEGEIIRRLLAGETICYSQDGDDAWLSGGDKASVSYRAILQLRKAGCLTRKNDDEGRVSWDEASAALRALADAGEAGK